MADNEVSWEDILQIYHWKYLLDNLCIPDISNELYQGLDGTPLITDDIYQSIQKSTKGKGNVIFLNHLKTGTVQTLRSFCQILRNTSKDYAVHKEVADILESDKRLWVTKINEQPSTSTDGTTNTSQASATVTLTPQKPGPKKDKTPAEIRKFLEDHIESHVQFCNVVDIRFDLETKKVINTGQRQQIEKAQRKSEAAVLFYQFLYDDPAPETLQGAAAVLRDAPKTNVTNKLFSKAIENFLGIYKRLWNMETTKQSRSSTTDTKPDSFTEVTDPVSPHPQNEQHDSDHQAEGTEKIPQWYKDAVDKQGSVTISVNRVVFVGSSRTGKTSLKYYLLHDKPREEQFSTQFLEAPDVATIECGNEATSKERGNEATSKERGNEATGKKRGNEATSKEHGNEATGKEHGNEATGKERGNEATSKEHGNEATSKERGNEATSKRHGNEATSKKRGNEATSKERARGNEATSKRHGNEATGKKHSNEATGKERGNEATSKKHGNEATGKKRGNEATGKRHGNEATSKKRGNTATDKKHGNEATGKKRGNEATGKRHGNEATSKKRGNEATGKKHGNEGTGKECGNEATGKKRGNEATSEEHGNEGTGKKRGNETTGKEHGDETTGKEHGDEATGKEHGDETTGKEHGDETTGKEHGDETTGKEHGDEATGKEHGNEATGKEHGNEATGKEHGNEATGKEHGDETTGKEHGDEITGKEHGDVANIEEVYTEKDPTVWKVADDTFLGRVFSHAEIKPKEQGLSDPLDEPATQPIKPMDEGKILDEDAEKTTHNKQASSETLDPDNMKLLYDAHQSFLRQHHGETEQEVQLEDVSFIYLLDTGGQPSFQNALPMVLDFPCNFVYTFNASYKLTVPYIDTYCRDGKTESKPEGENAQTTWELMQQSLMAAHTMSFKHKHDNLSKFGKQKPPKLCIYLVGTHLDSLAKLPNKDSEVILKDHHKVLDKLLSSKVYNEYRKYPKVVYEGYNQCAYLDSKLKGDKEHKEHSETVIKDHSERVIKDLRNQLSAKESCMVLTVPKLWYCFRLITHDIAKRYGKGMWSYSELKNFCMEKSYVQSDEQFQVLLSLFHSLGFFVYINLPDIKMEENKVCTDASFLYQELSKLLSVQYPKPGEVLSKALCHFKKTGEILFQNTSNGESRHELFNDLGINLSISPKWLLDVLHQIGLASKVTSDEGCHFFLPTVLPSKKEFKLPKGTVANLGFTISFRTKFKSGQKFCYGLPTGLFHRLVVHLESVHNTENNEDALIEWESRLEDSDHNHIKFYGKVDHHRFDIYLIKRVDHIELMLLLYKLSNQLEGQELARLCIKIKNEMKERICQVWKGLFGDDCKALSTGVICTLCEPNKNGHLMLLTDDAIAGECIEKGVPKGLQARQSIWMKDLTLEKKSQIEGELEKNDCYWCLNDSTSAPKAKRQKPETEDSSSDSTDNEQELTPDKIIQFLDTHKAEYLDHCNVKVIRFALKNAHVISRGQRQQLENALTSAAANDLFYQFLHDNPAPETLVGAAKALKEAPGTTNMNKRFAKAIEEFLNAN